MEKDLTQKIENYIAELNRLTDSMTSGAFPFSDMALAYADVAEHLKAMLEK